MSDCNFIKIINSPVYTIFPRWSDLVRSNDKDERLAYKRARCIVRESKIYSVGMMCLQTEYKLRSHWFVGARVVKFIKKSLERHGLNIGMTSESMSELISSSLHDVKWEYFFEGLDNVTITDMVNRLKLGVDLLLHPSHCVHLSVYTPIELTLFSETDLLDFGFSHEQIEFTKSRLAVFSHTLWKDN